MEGNHYGYDFELGRGKNISVNEVAKMMEITPTYKLLNLEKQDIL